VTGNNTILILQKEIDKKGGEQYRRISDFCCFHSQDQIGKDKRSGKKTIGVYV
jgi:hypothetical protein